MDSEIKNLTDLGTWIVVDREDMPPNQRTVNSKWTFVNLNGELIVHTQPILLVLYNACPTLTLLLRYTMNVDRSYKNSYQDINDTNTMELS